MSKIARRAVALALPLATFSFVAAQVQHGVYEAYDKVTAVAVRPVVSQDPEVLSPTTSAPNNEQPVVTQP